MKMKAYNKDNISSQMSTTRGFALRLTKEK